MTNSRIDLIGQNGNDGLHYGMPIAEAETALESTQNEKTGEGIDPIVESVRKKILRRSQFGLQKYGVGLDRGDLTTLDWLIHAQEEAMDLAAYLEVLIQQLSKR
jgi:hypothetical protein